MRATITAMLARGLAVAAAPARAQERFIDTFRPSDFGIQPASFMGGSVKVKDEIEVAFDIVPEG